MKKILSLILVTATLFSLSSCDYLRRKPDFENEISQNSTAELQTAEPVDTEPPETEPSVTEIDYKTIDCTHIEDWKDIGIKWAGNDFVFVAKFPADWDLAPLEGEEDKTYVILRDGTDIGIVSTVAPKASLDTLESKFFEIGGIELDYDVRKVKEGKRYVFRRVFGFFYDDFRVFFEIDYNELDDANSLYIANSVEEGNKNGGELLIPMDGGNSSRRTIVIGNSFVRTSQIGDYLDIFYKLGNKHYTLERFTHNGQSVEDYAKESWLKEFRNGTYHVVFLCGLYNAKDAENFPKVVEACKQSNTKLVIFPAHNEKFGRVEEIREKYPDIYYLGWRDEINLFIDNGGVDYWDFCINDGDKHSKPLAGYVGAHMIYCALYGEVPPIYTTVKPHSISYLKSMLGDEYIETGVAPGERIYTVYEITD